MAPTSLPKLAGRVPQRWRRRVPMRLRNALVARFGHPGVEPFDPAAHPDRLNLGCGYDKREGYLNVDLQGFHGPDLVGDVRSLPALPSGRYTEIVAQDVLEHLERADGPVALAEWRRLAAPGARLDLRVPDLPSLLRWLREKDDPDHHRRVLHHMFGTQAYNGDFHLSGYTELLLCDELFRADFGDVEMGLHDEWLWDVEATAGGSPLGLVWGPGFHAAEVGGGLALGRRVRRAVPVPGRRAAGGGRPHAQPLAACRRRHHAAAHGRRARAAHRAHRPAHRALAAAGAAAGRDASHPDHGGPAGRRRPHARLPSRR